MKILKKQNKRIIVRSAASYVRTFGPIINLLLLAFVTAACIEETDLISTDPNYNGASENLSCDPVVNCPSECRYYVDVDGSNSAIGRSWETAMRHIQPAINKAYCAVEACKNLQQCDVWVAGQTKAEAEQLDMANKTYGYDDNGNLLSTIRLRSGVNMYGGFTGRETTPDEREFLQARPKGGSAFDIDYIGLPALIAKNRIMEVEGSARIDGFRFFDGELEEDAAQGGGAIWAYGPKVTIANCTFSGNGGALDMVWGGAIFVDGGDAEISYSTFEDNIAINGGAVAITGGSLSADRCIFMSNAAAEQGGAIYKTNARDLLIQNSAFYYNSADEAGGAIEADCQDRGQGGTFPAHQSMTVLNSFFMANQSLSGSAISQLDDREEDEVTIENTIGNCTFLGNTSTSMGTTILLYTGRVVNSIVWPDMITAADQVVIAPEVSHSIVKNWADGGTTSDEDPLIELVSEPFPFISTMFRQPFHYTLSPNSPCIDAGDGDAAPEIDFHGNSRTDISSVENTGTGAIDFTDIGAVEAADILPDTL